MNRNKILSFILKIKSIDTNSLYRWKSKLVSWFDQRLTKVVAEKSLLKLGYEATP